MTSINSSYMSLYSNSISAASTLASDQTLLNQFNTQSSQSASSNAFGGAFSLDLSNSALSALNGGSSDGNSADSILGVLGYSNYSGSSQSGSSGIEALLGLGGDSSSPITPTSLTGDSFAQATAADGGPLPAFLSYVDSAMHLSSTQQQSLQAIANENMNANYTPQAVQTIASELQQAGISETI